MKKKLATLLATLLLIAGCAGAMAAEKTLTVGADEGYTTIQEAIDYIATQEDKTGWTINVKAGEYEDFVILKDMNNLSIIGDGDVTINVLDGTSGASQAGKDLLAYTADSVYVNSANVTLKNLYFNMGSVVPQWCSSAVSIGNGKNSMAMSNGLVIDSCSFVSSSGTGYGVFMDNMFDTATIKNCIFEGMAQAIYMENSGSRPDGMVIDNNTFTNCSFAFHGSYSHYVDGNEGSFAFTNNTLTGTDDLRCKFIFQDTDNWNNAVITISGNTVKNAVIGMVNLNDNGEAVLKNNTYGENSFTVNAVEPGTIEVYAVFSAPDEGYGEWLRHGITFAEYESWYKSHLKSDYKTLYFAEKYNSDNDDFNAGFNTYYDQEDVQNAVKASYSAVNDYIDSAITKANENHNTTLNLSYIDQTLNITSQYLDDTHMGDLSKDWDYLIPTFTWFKDAIYWETLPAPTPAPTETPAPTATPVPNTSNLPDTGDHSSIALFAALLSLSAAGMLLMRRRSAKR